MNSLYYIVELMTKLDGLTETVLVEEKNLANFLSNLDNGIYQVLNVCGVGGINLDFKKFLKQNEGLEQGGSDAGK
jgi:hypothetical protein